MTQTSLSEPVRLGVAEADAKQLATNGASTRDKAWRLVRRMALPVAILIAWQAITSSGWVSSASLPSPTAVVVAWWEWIFGPRHALAWYS
jgi:ABC-type nitrate/sulfonate/bicarbonate transport system permease component